jgi:regulator of protease activity HflC (stomatin/prohibitin superfamily)
VLDPNAATVNVADFVRATSQIAQTTLRSVLGQSALDDLLSERDKINIQLQQIIDEQTEPWGIKVSIVEVKDVELPQSMQRAMARQAEAEREKRAKIIHAEGEFQASQQLAEAAEVINRNPVTIQLRYLQTLTEIGAEKNTTVVFPLPIDIVQAFMGQAGSRRPEPAQPLPTPAAPSKPVVPAPAAADD